MPNTFHLKLQPSKYLCCFFLAAAVISLLSINLLAINGAFKIILFLLVLGYTAYLLWRYGFLLHSQSIIALWFNEDGDWKVLTKSQQWVDVYLQPDSLRTAFIIVLNFKAEAKFRRISLQIPRDSLPISDFCHLSMHLFSWR